MRHTITAYGWICVVALIIAVMIAFATPFGNYIGRSISIFAMSGNDAMEHAYEEGYEEQKIFYNEMFNGDIAIYKESGLYTSGSDYKKMTKKWSDLVTSDIIHPSVSDDKLIKLRTNYDKKTGTNSSASALVGELSIKAGIPIIDEYGFAKCTELTSVSIKDIQLIDAYAFLGCSKLKSIVIDSPALRLIEAGALDGCTSLTEIYFNGTYADFQKISIEEQNIDQTITVICSDASVKIKF